MCIEQRKQCDIRLIKAFNSGFPSVTNELKLWFTSEYNRNKTIILVIVFSETFVNELGSDTFRTLGMSMTFKDTLLY